MASASTSGSFGYFPALRTQYPSDVSRSVEAVSQATSTTTAVNLTSPVAVITGQAYALAAAGTSSFTCNLAECTTTSHVQVTIVYATAAAGVPIANVSAVANGSFTIDVTNIHASAALDAAIVFHVTVRN